MAADPDVAGNGSGEPTESDPDSLTAVEVEVERITRVRVKVNVTNSQLAAAIREAIQAACGITNEAKDGQ